MKRWYGAMLALALVAPAGCELDDGGFGPGGSPPPPRELGASYYGGAVYVTWELSSQWDGEAFRVYSKRVSDRDYFLIAEVTSCTAGLCSYTDTNVVPGVSYLYYVASVDPDSGIEAASEDAVQVDVPQRVAPPAPSGMEVVALDGANFLRWNDGARSAEDFSHYRVWLFDDDVSYLLGETDSEGFLDLLAQNGSTYTYFVTSLDLDGHESQGSAAASGTPRPDFQREWLWSWFEQPASSGFRFQESGEDNPIVDGASGARHFRLEVDQDGWWLVPGPDTQVYPDGFVTTALKCGVGADASCVDLDRAPTSGYVVADIGLSPQTSYALRVRGDDGQDHYAVIRVELLGFDQDDQAIMIFDWAYQLQSGNPDLAPHPAPVR